VVGFVFLALKDAKHAFLINVLVVSIIGGCLILAVIANAH